MKHNGPNLNKRDYTVRDIPHIDAKNFIEKNHYSKSLSNTSVYRHGLFNNDNILVGVAVWLPPTKNCAKASFGDNWRRCLSLTRFAICESVPRNGASFLLSRSIRKIKKIGDWDHLITFADEWQGHKGSIYLATNWNFSGYTKPYDVFVNGEGKMMGRKRGPKNLTKQEMLESGFILKGKFRKLRFTKSFV